LNFVLPSDYDKMDCYSSYSRTIGLLQY